MHAMRSIHLCIGVLFVSMLAAAAEPAGLRLVADLLSGPDGSIPTGLFEWNGKVWFRAFTREAGKVGAAICCTDGSTAGTRRIKDLPWQERGSLFDNPFAFENRLYFQGPNAALGKGSRVWMTDGTEAGTRPISEDGKDVCAEYKPVLIGDRLVLSLHGDYDGHGLVALNLHTDETEAIAVPFDGWEDYTDGAILHGALLKLDLDGRAFWSIDGTRAGLKKLVLSGLPKFQNDDGLNQFVSLPHGVLMLPNGDRSPLELWHTDGESVSKLATWWPDITAGRLWFGRVGDRGMLLAYDRTRRCGLWCSDGTAAGSQTILDSDPYKDATFSFPRGGQPRPVVSGGRLFFVMDDGVHGLELWCSDGTPAGTHLVMDMIPGADDAEIRRLYPAPNGQVLMECQSEDSGGAIWISDGSEAETRRLAVLGKMRFSELTMLKNTLLMQADDAGLGAELWALDLPAAKAAGAAKPGAQ